MTKINHHSSSNNKSVKNDNLKNLKPFGEKNSNAIDNATKSTDISKEAKTLNENKGTENNIPKSEMANDKALEVADKLVKTPVLPIAIPKSTNPKIQKQLEDKVKERTHYVNQPAVIFIEGFSAFGISNGDGIKDMAENYPGAKLFSWEEKDKIINEIKKHKMDQPVVLVGHSFGGDTAVEVAQELNSAKNSFHPIELIISLDSVGFKNNIMPINVKRNLNFFQEGIVPFLHGSPNIARNTEYTEVINELRNELHSRIDDAEEIQFKIFDELNSTLNNTEKSSEILIQLNLEDLIDSSQLLEKK